MTAGLALGCALLSRQMSIFYAPLLLLLAFRPEEPLLRITGERIGAAFKLGLPILAASSCISPIITGASAMRLNSGYNTIPFVADGSMLGEARRGLRPVERHYVPFNLFYFLLQGFHADFIGAMRPCSAAGQCRLRHIRGKPVAAAAVLRALGRVEFSADHHRFLGGAAVLSFERLQPV